jgi:hypothetical protein
VSDQQNADGEYPLALAPGVLTVSGDDRLVLVLRSLTWSERNVQDIIDALNDVGLGKRYVILYLDKEDEAHVVRGGSASE